ncbi:MAG: hypothetical protein NW216_13405 [Hyphomicrobium sp.]|nr:hypothetical protein [Hyphomicrobium sp.]
MTEKTEAEKAREREEDDKKKRRAALLLAYRRQDRARWLWWLFKSPSEGALVTTMAGAVAATVGWIGIDRYEVWALKREPAAQVEVVRETPNSTVFEIIGFDKAGRRGVFDVVVLKKEFKWAHASDTEVEREGRQIPANALVDEAFDADVRGALAEALEIVGVGTASQEGEGTRETERAGRRAARTAEIAKTASLDHVPLWTLNLGQYREPCEACETTGTSWQRPFIVVAVKELQKDANLGEALADAMTGRERLPSPTAYSAFVMTKLRG